jgi:hypothetical protein
VIRVSFSIVRMDTSGNLKVCSQLDVCVIAA